MSEANSFMTIRRVRVAFSGTPVNGGGLGTFYFDNATGTDTQCVAAVATYLGTVDGALSNELSWVTEADVVKIDEATGVITGTASVSTQSGTGSEIGDDMSPTTQGLVRLRTQTIVAGRELRGREFLPGIVEAHNNNGVPAAGFQTSVNNAAAALIADANCTWMVWSPTHGTAAAVLSASLWTKWAVLRSRRD